MKKFKMAYKAITSRTGKLILFERPVNAELLEKDNQLLLIVPEFGITIEGSSWDELELSLGDKILDEIKKGINVRLIDLILTITKAEKEESFYVLDSYQSEVSLGY